MVNGMTSFCYSILVLGNLFHVKRTPVSASIYEKFIIISFIFFANYK